MLIGWGFIYLTSEGWGSKETITDNELRKKTIIISVIFSTTITSILVLISRISFSELLADWYVLWFYWLLFLAIPWMIIDIRIWIKNRKK